MTKEWIGLLGVLWMGFVTAYYLRAIFIKGVKPHLFSWLIWGILSSTAGAAQLAAQGGVGGWMTLVKSAMVFVVVLVTMKRGEKNITRTDWAMFLGALAAIPLWLATKEPLTAVLIATLIDMAGYAPTFRKAFVSPREESAGLFILSSASSLFIVAGFESYSLTTVLYPVAILTANFLLVTMIFWRRRFV